MCCILYCLSHTDFGLVLINNRDEYLKRPTTASKWHPFSPPSQFTTKGSLSPSVAILNPRPTQSELYLCDREVLSGLDAHPDGGGTWLGITKVGRIAALTNFSETAPPPLPEGRGLTAYRSRGSLTKDFLNKDKRHKNGVTNADIEEYLHEVASHLDEWPGFNLLVGRIRVHRDEKQTTTKIGYISNRSGKDEAVYLEDAESKASDGLSNSCWQEPWGKVKKGRLLLDEALQGYDADRKEGIDRTIAEDRLMEQLFGILENKVEVTDRSTSQESIQVPPIRLANKQWYATRTATVLLVRRNGFARWFERDVYVLSPQGKPVRGESLFLGPRYYEWTIQSTLE